MWIHTTPSPSTFTFYSSEPRNPDTRSRGHFFGGETRQGSKTDMTLQENWGLRFQFNDSVSSPRWVTDTFWRRPTSYSIPSRGSAQRQRRPRYSFFCSSQQQRRFVCGSSLTVSSKFQRCRLIAEWGPPQSDRPSSVPWGGFQPYQHIQCRCQ